MQAEGNTRKHSPKAQLSRRQPQPQHQAQPQVEREQEREEGELDATTEEQEQELPPYYTLNEAMEFIKALDGNADAKRAALRAEIKRVTNKEAPEDKASVNDLTAFLYANSMP